MTITHKLVAYPCHSKSICGRGGTGSKGILFIGDTYTVFEVVSGDEKKFLLGMVKLCLNDDASKRNITSNTLLPQLKEVENTVLKSLRYSIQEQDSNVQLAMWQKELVTKDNEVVCAYVSRMKSELISQSSRTEQQVKNLKYQIDNVN